MEWRPVPGFDGWYDVSSDGQVRTWRTRAVRGRRASTPRLLRRKPNAGGYLRLKLTHPVFGKVEVMVHQLVLCTFVSHRQVELVADHINGVRDDNRVENLRWVTLAENITLAATERGSIRGHHGGRAQSPLNADDVREIRRLRANGGLTLEEIAEYKGVSKSTISRISLGRSWADV